MSVDQEGSAVGPLVASGSTTTQPSTGESPAGASPAPDAQPPAAAPSQPAHPDAAPAEPATAEAADPATAEAADPEPSNPESPDSEAACKDAAETDRADRNAAGRDAADADAADGPQPADGTAADSASGTGPTTEEKPTTEDAPAVGADPTAGNGQAAGDDPAKGDESGGDAGPDSTDRWTRFGPEPHSRPGRPRRVLNGVGRFLVHEWTAVCLAALALAIVMTWPCAWHPASTIPSDIWDPTLQAWQMAWSGHALLTDPLHLWNSNSFYPDTYSFAFSDTLFGYFPAGLIGTGPTAALVRYNIMFILLEALAFIGAYALLRQLGARRTAAAVAGAAFAYAPWRWSQAGHMHVMSVGGIALALAMLARGHGFSFTRGYQRDRTRPGWALAGWCVAAWQVSLGFGIGLPFAYVLIAVVIVSAVRWLFKGRPALGRRLLLFDGIGVLVLGAVGLFMGLPYLQVIKLHPEATRSLDEIRLYSPALRSFITAPQQSLPWGAAHEAARAAITTPIAESTLLPGFMLYGLAAAGLFFSIWSLRTRLWLLAGTVLSMILAMGTQFYGGTYTYVLLYKYLPFFSSSRTPGRLVIWTTLLLAILAAGAVGALVGRSYDVAAEHRPVASRPGLALRLATLLPLLLVLAEGTNWHTLPHPVVPTQPAAFRTVEGPMLVLPSDSLIDENVMLWSTSKFQDMVNGGSGFLPNDQQQARQVAKSFPDQGSVDYLRQIGVRTVVVLKQQAAGSADYAKAAAPDVPIDGLGISRQDEGDTIVYTLN
jgi:hypothetical protein